MSCPDWTALIAWRDDRRGVEPEGWSDALAHFDGGCPLCRKAALKADPTLVFRRLAQVPAARMTEAQERAEVDSVRQAVAAMRAASRLDRTSRRGVFARGVLAAGGWKRWSAAAALALMTVTVPSDDARRTADVRRTADARWTADARRTAPEAEAPAAEILDLSGQAGPVLEGGVGLPGSRVYHLGSDELAVVMVVNESFDESFGG